MIKKYCIYEFRVERLDGESVASPGGHILKVNDPNHTNRLYSRCKCITIQERRNGANQNNSWYCHVLEDILVNSIDEQSLMKRYNTFILKPGDCTRLNIDTMHVGKVILEISEVFLWPSLEETIYATVPIKLSGMICNNPNCKEHFPWADSPNIGDKFLCYSCRTNPTTRIILGY